MQFYLVHNDINSVTLSDIENFVLSCLTDNNAVYAVMPIVVNNDLIPSERFMSIGGQMIMTKLVKPLAILNRLESGVKKLIPEYGLNGMIIGTLIFK